jgi:small GTP-binding protein
MSKKQNEKAIRLLTLGNSMVGKSSIILRYIENKFYDSYISTIGVDFFKKMVNIQKKEYQLHIFDSAGQEKYKSISKQYYHRSEGIMLVFDLTSKSSFDSILNWIEDIENGAEKGIPIVLVGNKSDLVDREVSKEEAEELASKKLAEFRLSASLFLSFLKRGAGGKLFSKKSFPPAFSSILITFSNQSLANHARRDRR